MKKTTTTTTGLGKSRKSRSPEVRGDHALAVHYGVVTKTVYSWRQFGLPHRKEGGEFFYLLSETDPWVELQRRSPDMPAMSPAARAKLRFEEARASQKEIEAARAKREEEAQQGNILPRDEWELFAIEVIQKARDQFMRLPKTLCKHVPRKFHAVLQKEGESDVRKICDEMARDLDEGASD